VKYKTIFIANLAEIAKPLAELMEKSRREDEIFEDHALCDRFLFSDLDNRILVTPFALDPDYVEDTRKLLNDPHLVNLFPAKVNDSVCEAIIKDKKLLNQLTKAIKDNPKINLIAYAVTPEFLKLIIFLKDQGLSFKTPEVPEERARWTSAFFDSKGGFRQAVPYLGQRFTPMPEGFICRTPGEIIGWADYLLEKDGGCVLKTNRGLAGAGVKLIRKKDLKNQSLADFINEIIKKDPYWTKELTVVEQLVDIDESVAGGNPSVEFQVTDNKVIPLYVCGMRVTAEGVFRGVEIGKGAVPSSLVKSLFNQGRLWAKFLQKVGYRGFFDIDWVYDKKGKVYPIESNIRRTGGTHVYELAKRLLGKDYQKNYYIVANNIMNTARFAKKSYSFIKKELSSLLYPKNDKKEGVILTDITYLVKGNLGYVVIGKNKKRVAEIEESFLKLL
jgi:hypothetical protein